MPLVGNCAGEPLGARWGGIIMQAFGLSNQGLVRTNNEDAYHLDIEKGLLIVADGMGGHAGGEEASKLAVGTIVDFLQNDDFSQPEDSIKRAILAANRVVLTKSATDPALTGMGTTLTLALALPDFLITGHIGDSKAYLIDDSQLRCLTSDDSVSGQLLATGKITDAEAEIHPQRHVLMKALGTDADLKVEVLRHPWSKGQYLLLCSDGLTEVVSTQEILIEVNKSGNLQDKVNRLVSIVLDRGAPDNVTIILAQF